MKPEDGQDTQRPFSRVLARNISTLLSARREADRRRALSERLADDVTQFTGSLRFVALHALLFGAWIVWNLGWLPMLRPFDPTFVVLAMVASVEAIFLSTFVLISQNRMQRAAERRAELDLQISLLAEHEVTKLIDLVDRVADKLGIEREDPDIQEAKRDVDPGAVLHAIERESAEN